MKLYKRIRLFLLCLLLAIGALSLTVSASEYGEASMTTSDIFLRILIGVAIGLAAGLITVLLMRRSMNTVRKQKNASVYTEKDSFVITESRDIYLYSRVTRVRVQSNNKKN